MSHMWITLCLVNLLESHTSQTQSMTTAQLWLQDVLRNHTSSGRAVRPWTGSGDSRRCVVISGHTPNVWAKPWFPYCGMTMKTETNGSRLTSCCSDCADDIPEPRSSSCWTRTGEDLCAVAEKLMRADGRSTNTVLVRGGRGNASCSVPVKNEWPFGDDNSGERKTLLKTLYGAIRSGLQIT